MRKRMTECEYDLHGLHVDAVAARLETILARHAPGGAVVRIIHGKGTGALADEVARLARRDPRVVDCYRSGLNAGVTILQLQPGPTPKPTPQHPPAHYPIPPIRKRKAR